MAYGNDPQMHNAYDPNTPGQVPPPPPVDPNEKNWCVIAHLSALVGLLGLGFGHVLGPLVVWLIKKGDSPVVAEHAKAALNFQITMTIIGIVCLLLMLILIGYFLIIALAIFTLVNTILGAMAASEGRLRPYPWSLKLIQ